MAHLISFISNGIIESGQLIPNYLDLLYQEESSVDLRETHLSMYCFWSGEKNLAGLQGVVATRSGYMNGTEVVKVKYDAGKVSEDKLISFASQQKCADAIYTNDKREEKVAKKLKIKTKREGKFRADREPKWRITAQILGRARHIEAWLEEFSPKGAMESGGEAQTWSQGGPIHTQFVYWSS